jgi:hypothetical protein
MGPPAARHGLRRRNNCSAGGIRVGPNGDDAATFVPVIAGPSGEAAPRSETATTSVIEIELAGMVARVCGLVGADALAEVLTAVKRVG